MANDTKLTKRQLNDLARMTERYMLEIDARWDYKKKQRSYMTRADWLENFEHEGVKDCDFIPVIATMFALKMFVGFTQGKGFYICKPSDSATYFTRLINYWWTLGNTINYVIDTAAKGKKWKEIADGFKGRLKIDEVDQLPSALEVLGIEVSADVKKALVDCQVILLEAKDRHGAEAQARRRAPILLPGSRTDPLDEFDEDEEEDYYE